MAAKENIDFLDGIYYGMKSKRVYNGKFCSPAMIEILQKQCRILGIPSTLSQVESECFEKYFTTLAQFEFDSTYKQIVISHLEDNYNRSNRSNRYEIVELIEGAVVAIDVPYSWQIQDSLVSFEVFYKHSEREQERRKEENKRWQERRSNRNPFKIGDQVVRKDGRDLRSGSSSYSFAIVSSLVPFSLVSESRDMKWSLSVHIDDFELAMPF